MPSAYFSSNKCALHIPSIFQEHSVGIVRCHNESVNFLPNPHSRHPIAHLWGSVQIWDRSQVPRLSGFQEDCLVLFNEKIFVAATKQLYEWFSPSVSVRLCIRLSVTPFWQRSCYCVIMKFSEVITIDKSDVHAKGQGHRSRSQRSKPSLTVSEP